MSRERRIYVDVDDCLSETAEALLLLLEERFDLRLDVADLQAFDLETQLGLQAADFARFMDLAHHPEVLDGMAVVAGAREALEGWRERGYSIEIVTGRPPDTAAVTRRWLERAGLPHDAFACVDKYHRHADHPDRIAVEHLAGARFRLAVEDSPDMACWLATHADATVALLDRPWNRVLPDLSDEAAGRLVRVSGWDEIRERWPAP